MALNGVHAAHRHDGDPHVGKIAPEADSESFDRIPVAFAFDEDDGAWGQHDGSRSSDNELAASDGVRLTVG